MHFLAEKFGGIYFFDVSLQRGWFWATPMALKGNAQLHPIYCIYNNRRKPYVKLNNKKVMKTGFWLKGGKGKLAGATVYQQNGETVMREVVSPSNPKTDKQMIQRIIMHTVMSSYSKMKEIVDHSFEGVKKGSDTMSYYLSQNVGFAREKVSQIQASGQTLENIYNFMPLKAKGFTPNQYQVAMGSLPPVKTTLREEDDTKAFVPAIVANTYQAVCDALGLQRGDQLTFLMIDANTDASFGQCNFHFCRVILDPTNPDNTQAAMSSAFVSGGAINLPSVRNEGNFTFEIDAETGLSFTYKGSLTCVAAAVIVSREQGDKWLRSTTYLTYSGQEEYSLGQCLEMAKNGNATIYSANSQYLNNAGVGGGTGAAAGNQSGGGSSNVNPGGDNPLSLASITSASIDGQSMIAGTPKNITVSAAPASKALVVTVENGNHLFVAVKAGNTEIDSAPVGAEGVTTITHNWEAGVAYKVYLMDEDSNEVDTSYQFQLTVDAGNTPSGVFSNVSYNGTAVSQNLVNQPLEGVFAGRYEGAEEVTHACVMPRQTAPTIGSTVQGFSFCPITDNAWSKSINLSGGYKYFVVVGHDLNGSNITVDAVYDYTITTIDE